MTRRLAEAVQRAAERAVTQNAAGWRLATITATYTDGTSDIATAHGPVLKVRRLASYASPAVSDRVMVAVNSDGNWLIIGKLATT